MDNIHVSFNEGDNEILNVSLNCQPFKVGERVNLSIDVRNKEKWDAEDFQEAEYIIESIESYVNVSYAVSVHEYVSFDIQVRKVS